MHDSSDPTQEIREYRYSGANVNNYVIFNDDKDGVEKEIGEVWRIIGIFKDTVKDADGEVVLDSEGNPTYEEKIKLMRNTPLSAEEISSSFNVNGVGLGGANSSGGVYWTTRHQGNSNDWTKAGLQYFLNTEEDVSGNKGYLSFLTPEAKNLISKTTYYLGNVTECGATTKTTYNDERNENNISNGNSFTWNGLVGLLYPSDYGYTVSQLYWDIVMNGFMCNYNGYDNVASDGVVPVTTSWMIINTNHDGDGEWFISPATTVDGNPDLNNGIMSLATDGIVFGRSAGYMFVSRPVLYLVSDAKILDGGIGSIDNPYVVVE